MGVSLVFRTVWFQHVAGSASTGAQQTTGSSTTNSETKSHSKGFSQTVTKKM